MAGKSKSIPPVFKPITPFIRRAEELDHDKSRGESQLVAFYCRQFAMEMGIQLREKDDSDEATSYLLGLMDQLEKEKEKMPEFSSEEARQVCTEFALGVFKRADDEDRSGAASKNTARTFYAAGSFFDILRQFGDLDEDTVEKIRYCKFKAADILKAIKEGRTPTPGAPGENDISDDMSLPPAAPVGNIEVPAYSPPPPVVAEPSPAQPSPPVTAPVAPSFDNLHINAPDASADTIPYAAEAPVLPPAAPLDSPMHNATSYSPPQSYDTSSATTTTSHTPSRTGRRTKQEIGDALEYAQFAVAALKTEEVNLAIDRLEMALKAIR